MLFGRCEIAAVVEEGAQIDVSGSVFGFDLDHLLINRDRLVVRAGMFLQSHAANEQIGRRHDRRDWPYLCRDHGPHRLELHDELTLYGFKRPALMAERKSAADAEYAGFEEGILHAGDLLAHRYKRFSNDRRTHTLGTKVTNLFQLDEIKEGEIVRNRRQTGPLPTR